MSILTLPNPGALTVRAKALVFEDPRSNALLERIRQVAPSEATVLIIGETGTGKELVARHIHELSAARGRPFVAVNCGAFPRPWSRASSSATSAAPSPAPSTPSRAGSRRPTAARCSSTRSAICRSLMQVKLLRVLQEREVVRLGARQPIPIDVRLVAATNVDLEQAVARRALPRGSLLPPEGRRCCALPPLRERPGDILPLAASLLGSVPPAARCRTAHARRRRPQHALLAHAWPGNIRELENVIHSAVLVGHSEAITADDLPLGEAPVRVTASVPSDPGDPFLALGETLQNLFNSGIPDLHARIEATLMRTAFEYCHHNQLQTARLLGISRNVLRARLIEIGEIAGPARGSSAAVVS